MYERKTNFVSLISAFAIGGLIGAGIALLMAPQSGTEMREQIRNKSMEFKDKALETAEDTRTRASRALNDVTQQTKEKVSSLSKRGQQTIEDGKRRIEEELRSA